jgi:ATP-binding cassette subfamily F protein 3
MLLLSCAELSRGFDSGPLFEHLGFELHAGERVGLVGPNGAGKTTLLRILSGLDQPDTGEVRRHAGARVGVLQQHPEFTAGTSLFAEARSALNEFLAAHDDMIRTAEELARATQESARKTLAARYDRLHEMLSHHDAFHLDHHVEEVLEGLGFAPADFQRPLETFSGGQQNRLMLAKILLATPDVMLLDEPSNHLDIDATKWLENYLAQQPEGMLIVSHDRYFLDKVVNKIFELYQGRLSSYPGNYRAYVRLRQERYELQLKTWEAQREYIDKQEEYIRRVHYGQLHKQAQSRQKQLDRLERVERPVLIEAPQMHFGAVRRSGDVVLHVEDLAKSYGTPLFQNLSFDLKRGQRLGIMGPNGSGKTTLLRILLGEEKADQGKVEIGHLVDFGYYDQQLDILQPDVSVLDAVWPDHDQEAKAQDMRNLLGRFGLTGDQFSQKVGALSGGERSRAALARLVALGANVLVLDEPTNHLDLWACDALEHALLEFEGTVIVVSHDRYFLNRVVDLLIALEGNSDVQVIHGNYDTYERMRTLRNEEEPVRRQEEPARRSAATADKLRRKRRFPYRKVEDLEADIAAAETRLREVEQLLASPSLYREGNKIQETTAEFEQIKRDLQQLYEHWEEAVELNG